MVLVKVNCLGNCFQHDICGDNAFYLPGVQCGQGLPPLSSNGNSHPTKPPRLPSETPNSTESTLPGSWLALNLCKSSVLPKPCRASPFTDQIREGKVWEHRDLPEQVLLLGLWFAEEKVGEGEWALHRTGLWDNAVGRGAGRGYDVQPPYPLPFTKMFTGNRSGDCVQIFFLSPWRWQALT